MKRRTRAPAWKAAALLTGLTLLGLGSAESRTIRIVQADRLELNKVDGQEIVVISGDRVELNIDSDVVIATRVEFNRSRRTLTLIGRGRYDSVDSSGAVQRLVGSDLVVNLGSEAITGQDVILSDAALEIRGEEMQRVPGQFTAQNSYFTPCAKCGRTPDDYAFKAKRLLLYPGDRLIGYEATLLLAGAPVLYLPVVALPLNDQARQPRFSYTDDATDGYTFKADLPFAYGSNVLGTTFLRYYQNRSPSFGGGGAFTVYAPTRWLDRLDVFGLAEPNSVNSSGTFTSGYALNASLTAKGHFDLANTAPGGLTYSVSALRQDIGLLDTDPNKGVTNITGQADVTFTNLPAVNNLKFGVSIVNRLGPEPTAALNTVLKKPEVVIDPDPFRVTYRNGNTLSADFKFTVGNYQAQSNPLSRAATLQGPNYSTARLQEEHNIVFLARPWQNADLNITNTFTGRYYLTGQRVVDLLIGVSLTQTFGMRAPSTSTTPLYTAYGTPLSLPSSAGTFTIGYQYLRKEGVSPFAFDRLDTPLLSAPVTAAVNLTPGFGVAVRLSQAYDLIQPADNQQPADLNISVAQEPLQLNLDVRHNFFQSRLESVTASGSYGASAARGLNFSFAGSYTRLGGPDTLTTTVKGIGGVRTNTFGVSLVQDLKLRELRSVNLSASAVSTRDAVLNPVTFNLTENLNLQTPHLDGTLNVNWRNLAFGSTHSLTLPGGSVTPSTVAGTPDNPGSDTLYFSVGNVPGGSGYGYTPYTPSASQSLAALSSLTWNLRYGGPFDLAKTQWTQPSLTAALTASRPAQRLSAQASLALPGSLRPDGPYLQSASVSGDYQLSRRVAISGLASYTRTQPYTAGQPLTEVLNLQPLALNFTFGQKDRPDASLKATFQQTLSWVNGVRTDTTPFQPILLLTIDRCCWAFQAEINPLARRFRIGLVIPGAGGISAFEDNAGVLSVPLVNPVNP